MAAETQTTTSRVELIDKWDFAKAAIDENFNTFIVHMLALDVTELSIYLSQTAQIAAL